ncbi:Extended synaptotagmin-3, partial [Chelonia mydas]
VHTPDVERVEWLNKVLVQAWPYFGTVMEKTFKEKIEPKIRAKNVHLKTCTFTKIHFGEKLHGTLRVILEPLITDVPFFGALTMCFVQKPHLEVNWAGLTNLLDAPGISSMSDTIIQDLIAARLVLPNRITIPLKKNMKISHLRFPIPYFVVHEVPGQDLEVDLYDEDPDKDDFLGSLLINLADVMNDRIVDEWFPLSKTASGHLHLKLEWLSLVTDQEKLHEDKNGLATALLIVYLDSACNLPTCNFSKDPVWGQAFTFFVHSAQSQSLHLEIKDKDQENALGTLVVSLSHLLKDSEMTLDQKFQLDHSGLDSFIKMKLVLRALCIKEPDPQSNYTSVNALKQVILPAAEKGGNQCKNPLPSKPEPSKMPHVSKDSGVPESKEAKKESNADLTESENPAGPAVNETITELNAPAGAQNLETQPLEPLPIRTLEHNAASRVASLGSLASSCFELDHSYPNLLKNLMPASNRGVDPYVRVYLLPDKRWASRKKTTVKKKTLNPHYDEKFEFFESLVEVKKRTLDVAVKNSMPFISRERRELGKNIKLLLPTCQYPKKPLQQPAMSPIVGKHQLTWVTNSYSKNRLLRFNSNTGFRVAAVLVCIRKKTRSTCGTLETNKFI